MSIVGGSETDNRHCAAQMTIAQRCNAEEFAMCNIQSPVRDERVVLPSLTGLYLSCYPGTQR
jgi:hypothetical protein